MFDHFEGIIATDHRIGNLFVNLRLTKTDFPIRMHADMPIVQVQPVPRTLLAETVLGDIRVENTLGPREWEQYYRTIAEPNTRPDRPLGAYAVAERRARRREAV